MTGLRRALIGIATIVALGGCATNGPPPSGDRGGDATAPEVLEEVLAIVERDFLDPDLRGLDWLRLTDDLRTRVTDDTSDDELRSNINELLARLETSHTRLYTPSDPAYHALASVFSGDVDGYPFPQIGAWFERIDGRWFVRNVFEESAAARAGILAGDEIVSVDDRPLEPVRSFERGGPWHRIAIRREAGGPTQTIPVEVDDEESLQRTQLRAMRASARTYDRAGRTIGYAHLWSGTHEEFRRALLEAIRQLAPRSDALVLDLRDGFGGAHPGYLETLLPSDENDDVYTGPLVVLINEGTRSGKEWLAALLARRPHTLLVGARTQGAFVAGRRYELFDGRFLLYLAVAPGPEGDGLDLEGKGVSANVRVEMPLPYRAGIDAQLERALDEAAASVQESHP